MKEVGATRVQFGRGFRFSEQYQKTLPVFMYYITFKIFAATCASNGRLIEWKIALFHKTNFLSDQPPL